MLAASFLNPRITYWACVAVQEISDTMNAPTDTDGYKVLGACMTERSQGLFHLLESGSCQ